MKITQSRLKELVKEALEAELSPKNEGEEILDDLGRPIGTVVRMGGYKYENHYWDAFDTSGNKMCLKNKDPKDRPGGRWVTFKKQEDAIFALKEGEPC